jgi:nitrate reductase assembly molybdenum cofactor insertion protein NarJ
MAAAEMTMTERAQALVREAARWRLIGRLFECPGDQWRRDIAALARELGDDELDAVVQAALETAAEGTYHSVFGPGGPAPPREASYHDTIELGSLMSELTGYYYAFGYRPSTGEPPDHVAVEVGFIAYLRLKEAYAVAHGHADHAATTAEAAERFRANHLAMMAGPLADLLADSEIGYLARATQLLAAGAGRRPPRTRLPVVQQSLGEDGSEFCCS